MRAGPCDRFSSLAAIAEFERERIGERIRDAKRHQRRSGQYRDAGTSFRNIAAQIEQTHGIQISHQGVKRVLERRG